MKSNILFAILVIIGCFVFIKTVYYVEDPSRNNISQAVSDTPSTNINADSLNYPCLVRDSVTGDTVNNCAEIQSNK